MARGRTLNLKVETEVKGLDKLDALGKKLQKVGVGLTAGVTVPLVALAAKSVEAASQLEQAGGAVESVFGQYGTAIEKFAETSAESFGLSQRQVKEFGSLLGAQLQSFGFEAGEAADMTVELQKRAADMAATFGGTVPDAVQAISSLMRGERNPIERYGVALKQADINARILALGLDTSTTAAKKQAEATAGLDLLYEQTANTQGQFARESDTLAGGQARLSAKLEDAQAALGDKLLPVMITAVDVLSTVVDAFSSLDDETQGFIVAAGAAAAALGPVLIAVGSLMRLVKYLPPGGILARLFPIGALLAVADPLDDMLGNVAEHLHDLLGLPDIELPEWMYLELNPFSEDFLKVPAKLGEVSQAVIDSGAAWEEYQKQTTTAMDESVAAVGLGVDAMAAEAGEAPGAMADELLAAQFRLTDATSQLVAFMEQAISPAAEMMQIQGFLASFELAEGLASNNPLIVAKSQEMRDAALSRLSALQGETYNYGYNVGTSFAAGMNAAYGWVVDASGNLAAAARGQIGINSEPSDSSSPLYGITKWGENIGRTLADGMDRSVGIVGGAAARMAGVVAAPTIASPRPSRMGAAAGGIVGGNVTNINLTFTGEPPDSKDERELVATLQRLAPFIDGRMAAGY